MWGTADAVSALGSRVSSASSCASIAALGGDQNSNHRPLMGPCDDQLDVLFRSGDRYCYPARVAMHGGVSKRLLSDSKETQCASPADVLYVTRSSTIGPWSHRKHHLSSARVELNTNAGFYLARARAKRASCGFNRGTGVTGSSPSQTCAARRTSTSCGASGHAAGGTLLDDISRTASGAPAIWPASRLRNDEHARRCWHEAWPTKPSWSGRFRRQRKYRIGPAEACHYVRGCY